MRVLMIGRMESWMKLHLEFFAKGFQDCGIEVRVLNYHAMERLFGFIKLPQAMKARRSFAHLKREIETFRPDVLLFVAALKFDPRQLREFFKGKIVFYDYDGIRALKDHSELLPFVDLLLTSDLGVISQFKAVQPNILYLPGAVDCQYFSPMTLTDQEMRLYGAPVSYIGRTTARRIELCQSLVDCGLVVYGERWHRQPICQKGQPMEHAWRFKRDVSDEEVRIIYCGSQCIINILQENAAMLSMQVFNVPACGRCLVTEWTDDLPSVFEVGKEILAFKTIDELKENVQRMLREPETARKIGEMGRKRCLADYTFKSRVQRILKGL